MSEAKKEEKKVPKGESTDAVESATRQGQAKLGAWIRIAIEHGGILTVSRSQWEFRAEVTWPLIAEADPISAEEASISEALRVLEENIQEDAADEMIKAGVV